MQKISDFTVIDMLYESGYHGPRTLDQPEFYWRSMLGAMQPYRDSYFRPPGEEIGSEDAREGIVAHHWDSVLPTISSIREAYCVRRNRDGAVTMVDLWFISKLCQLLPAYLIRRHEDSADADSIPVAASIIYRISLDMHRIVHLALVKLMASGGDLGSACLDADQYCYLAKNASPLIGRNSVCTGPQTMVEQAYGAMIGPAVTGPAAASAEDPGFYRYAALFMKLEAEKYMFAVLAAIQLRSLIKILDSATSNRRTQAFREELLGFEAWSAENTSPLAHEIAGEDLAMLLQGDRQACDEASRWPAGRVREHMLAGLSKVLDAADQLCLSSLGDAAVALLKRINVLRNSPAGASKYEAADFVRMGLDETAAGFAASALCQYRHSEHCATQIFQLLQSQLNTTLERRDDVPVFSGIDIANVFGPRLRHCYSDFFKESFAQPDVPVPL
jgi:hypothetical protein